VCSGPSPRGLLSLLTASPALRALAAWLASNVSRVRVVPVRPWAASAHSMISSSAMSSRSWRGGSKKMSARIPPAVRGGLLQDALGSGLGEDALEEGERAGGAPLCVRSGSAVLEAVDLVHDDDGHDERHDRVRPHELGGAVERRLRIGACLSLSGRFARFGRQAAVGLQAWSSLDGTADVFVEDDRSDRRTLEALLPDVAARCDILLGPYSTLLMRAAGNIAAESGWLIWNHGGSGDDVELAHPGHVVSVLTPTSRYAEPFLRYLAGDDNGPENLCIVQGPGSFGRQVADGAAAMAPGFGLHAVRVGTDDFPPSGLSSEWALFSAGVFEQDAQTVQGVLRLASPPRWVCAVSAGVRDFAQAVDNPDGVFGVAQWFHGSEAPVLLGPQEKDFLQQCAAEGLEQPDYPAAQAVAAAMIATHCARLAGGSSRAEDLWAAAAALDTSTLFGGFRIDPVIGTQVKHETTLLRWKNGEPMAVPRSTSVQRPSGD